MGRTDFKIKQATLWLHVTCIPREDKLTNLYNNMYAEITLEIYHAKYIVETRNITVYLQLELVEAQELMLAIFLESSMAQQDNSNLPF